MGKEPVPAGVGGAGKNVTPRPGHGRLTIPPAKGYGAAGAGGALIMLRAVDLAAALLVGLFERPETLHSQRFKLIASFFPIRPAS